MSNGPVSETEQTAQDVREEINQTAGIGQSIEQPGYFTKAELEGVVEYILNREQDISSGTSIQTGTGGFEDE